MNRRAEIDCDEAVRRLATFLDRELDGNTEEAVRRHLETCRSCFSRAEFERRLRERLREDLRVGSLAPEFQERVRQLLRTLPDDG
jgi:anti-sigma factor (TIGR02949 family)